MSKKIVIAIAVLALVASVVIGVLILPDKVTISPEPALMTDSGLILEGEDTECLTCVRKGELLTPRNVLDIMVENGGVLKGEKGDNGPQGQQGIQGPAGICPSTCSASCPKGLKGDAGSVGPQGVQGPAGLVGPQGQKGDKGDTGQIGPQGPAGDDADVPSGTWTKVCFKNSATWTTYSQPFCKDNGYKVAYILITDE